MEIGIIAIFLIGYLLISFEHPLRLEKAAIALLMGTITWGFLAIGLPHEVVQHALPEHLSEIAAIAFFLLGAMTIVEVIDAYHGFSFIPRLLNIKSKRVLLVAHVAVVFFLSALLDNLTTTIVMISIAKKMLDEESDLLVFSGLTVIAANAGGVFSPIGDVTTTMLWIGGQISTFNTITFLFLPAVASVLIPLLGGVFMVKGAVSKQNSSPLDSSDKKKTYLSVFILLFGIVLLSLVPVVKIVTGLPPYIAILFSLGLLWMVVEVINNRQKALSVESLTVTQALRRTDFSSVLFFVGILLAVSALQTAGTLSHLAEYLTNTVGNVNVVMVLLGVSSAVIDNVPLVSAAMNMFPITQWPQDHLIWQLLAYCAGTGGSILIIGSAAGITAMGSAKLNFGWYAKRFGGLTALGYFAGLAVILLQVALGNN